MVVIKYVGKGRKGTMEPKRIWAPEEIKNVPTRVAKILLEAPDFVKVEPPKPKPKPKKPRKPRRNQNRENILAERLD